DVGRCRLMLGIVLPLGTPEDHEHRGVLHQVAAMVRQLVMPGAAVRPGLRRCRPGAGASSAAWCGRDLGAERERQEGCYDAGDRPDTPADPTRFRPRAQLLRHNRVRASCKSFSERASATTAP